MAEHDCSLSFRGSCLLVLSFISTNPEVRSIIKQYGWLFVYLQILINSYHMLLMINGSYLVVPISLHQHHHHLIRKKIRIFNHSIHYNFLLSNVHFFQGILVYHLLLVLLLLLIILLLLHLIVEELEQVVSTHLTPAVTLSQ